MLLILVPAACGGGDDTTATGAPGDTTTGSAESEGTGASGDSSGSETGQEPGVTTAPEGETTGASPDTSGSSGDTTGASGGPDWVGLCNGYCEKYYECFPEDLGSGGEGEADTVEECAAECVRDNVAAPQDSPACVQALVDYFQCYTDNTCRAYGEGCPSEQETSEAC